MIFSRDLTWADDHEMRTLLKEKAKRHELSISMLSLAVDYRWKTLMNLPQLNCQRQRLRCLIHAF